MNTDTIREVTLWARTLLVEEASALLRSVYGLKEDGTFIKAKDLPALQVNGEAKETRRRLEQLIADEKDANVEPHAAVAKLVKEVAFTHLNRLVALKMLEHPDRRVVKRAAIAGYPEPNGFKMYLPEHGDDYKLYEQGAAPLDELSESPRDRAFRHFVLWQYGELAKEVRVLFDPDNLASRLFPRPRALRQLVDRLNGDELQDAWKAGNEETIGWVYQFFIAEEKAAAFKRVFKEKKKFQKEDVAAATQVFTPHWVVKFLVQNSLGSLWLSMHPDSALARELEYVVPLAGDRPATNSKSVTGIRLLDPATGTMHFGLVAFDLLISMYREEMANAGKQGWPKEPPVSRDEDIPASILAKNLFGIDIDLRAVQLSALALYIRAKAHYRDAVLSESNLACADVTIFRGTHRNRIASEMALPHGLTRQLLEQFCEALDASSMMGSLVRLEKVFREELFAHELKTAIDAYVKRKAAERIDESYFAGETTKGLRLLEVLMCRYDVVFTNPPYMSSSNMSAEMSAFLKRNYKNSYGDLYSSFIERCVELTAEGGRLAMITQQSFMFISSYEDLRAALLGKTAIEMMAHVGPRAFDEVQGEKVNTTAFVLRRESAAETRATSVGVYLRLVKEPDAEAKRVAFEEAVSRRKLGQRDLRVYEYRQADFRAIRGSPWVYWITSTLRSLFTRLPALKDCAEAKQGLATANNERFIRFWWEVGLSRIDRRCTSTGETQSSGEKWFPHMKGGGARRWFGYLENVVNWAKDGAEIRCLGIESGRIASRAQNTAHYFKGGITYSAVSGKGFAARLMPAGFCFDCAGDCLFPNNKSDASSYLALLNSKLARGLLSFINPTLNVNTEDLDRLPLATNLHSQLAKYASKAVMNSRSAEQTDETTYDFIAPPQWADGVEVVRHRQKELAEVEREIDEEVYRLYEISPEDRKTIESDLTSPRDNWEEESGTDESTEVESSDQEVITRKDVAEQWISYAVGVVLGRFQPGIGPLGAGAFDAKVASRLRELTDGAGIMVLDEGHPDDLPRHVLDILGAVYGDTETERIIRTATGSAASLREAVESYLSGEFFRDHVRQYRKRPVYWLIQSPQKSYSIYLFHEKATPDTLSLLRGNRYLGGRINRLQQQMEAMLKKDKRKAGVMAEQLEELQEFDRLLEAATRVAAKDKNGRNITVRWEPELDDGVYINAAPLHEVLPSWRDVKPQKAWQELEAGKYDWSKTAMRYWPQRVVDQCKKNKSYAIAHGLA